MRQFIMLALAISLGGAPAALADCPSYDIRDSQPTEVKEFLNTSFNQGGIGWCFAFATANILSVYLGRAVAPLDIAMAHDMRYAYLVKEQGENSYLSDGGPGGGETDALKALAKRGIGICLNKDLPSSVLNSRSYLLDSIREVSNLRDLREKKTDNMDYLVGRECELSLQQILPNLSLDKILDVVTKSQRKKLVSDLNALVSANCRGKRVELPKRIPVKELDRDEVPNVLEKVSGLLRSGLPVNIGMKLRNVAFSGGESHAMTILGQKEVDGVCQYIVRNSWGGPNSCWRYRDNIRPSCNGADGTFLLPHSIVEADFEDISYIPVRKR